MVDLVNDDHNRGLDLNIFEDEMIRRPIADGAGSGRGRTQPRPLEGRSPGKNFGLLILCWLILDGAGPISGAQERPLPPRGEAIKEAVEAIKPAVFRVGYLPEDSVDTTPESFGTAFLISRKHRLLATAAHVADLAPGVEGLIATRNETRVTYRVVDVWYHPSILRKFDEGLFSLSDDTYDGTVSSSSPDVAILRLAAGEAELPEECVLATEEELRSLAGKRVGALGFERAGDRRPSCTWAEGVVDGRIAYNEHHRADETQRPEDRPWISTTRLIGPGGSGGPVFLPNGHVIGIYTHGDRLRDGTVNDMSIWANAVRQTLVAHGLDGRPIARFSPSILTSAQKDERERVREGVRLVREAEDMTRRGAYQAAGERCNDALRLVPNYAWARLRRSQNYLHYCQSEWARLGASDRARLCQYAWEDVDSCLKSTGYEHDVRGLILGYAVVYVALANADLSHLRRITGGLSESIDSAPAETAGAWKAEMTNLRAYCWEALGEFEKSGSDHATAIRLDPAGRRWRLDRADFLDRQGRRREAAEDRAATPAPSRD